MRASSHELAWVVCLLEDLPQVELLSLRVEPDDLPVGDVRVPIITVQMHAPRWADAMALAAALRLREGEGRLSEGYRGELLWRNWSGWAAEGSHEQPVRVSVTACEREHEFATLFDETVA